MLQNYKVPRNYGARPTRPKNVEPANFAEAGDKNGEAAAKRKAAAKNKKDAAAKTKKTADAAAKSGEEAAVAATPAKKQI